MGVVHLLNAFQGQVWEKATQKPKEKANSSSLSDGVKQWRMIIIKTSYGSNAIAESV